MTAPPRPSDIFRLPDDPPPPARPPEEPAEPARRRVPAWAGVAVLVAFGAGLAALGATGAGSDGAGAPVVDVVREDHAIQALALYGQEVEAVTRLQDLQDLYRNGGTSDAVQRAARSRQDVTAALEQAQGQVGADTLASSYWNHGGHARLLQRLTAVDTMAARVHLLSATHATLFSGAGEIGLDQAHAQLVSWFSGGPEGAAAGPLEVWADALLEEIEGGHGAPAALAAREATQQHWRATVGELSVPAVPALRAYLNGLPPGTVKALEGHPLAGPALERLPRR